MINSLLSSELNNNGVNSRRYVSFLLRFSLLIVISMNYATFILSDVGKLIFELGCKSSLVPCSDTCDNNRQGTFECTVLRL